MAQQLQKSMQSTKQKATKITLQRPDFSNHVFFFASDKTISSLKEEVANYTYLNPEQMNLSLLHGGQYSYLLEGNKKVGEIGDGVNLNIRVETGTKGIQFNNLNQQVTRNVGKATDPKDHMIVCRGLNMHSVCNTKDCIAFGRQIRVKRGFNPEFNINKQSRNCFCPRCNKKSAPSKNFGFYKCKITIVGELQDQTESKKIEIVADDELYHTFADQEKEQLAHWVFLTAKVQELP